MLSFEELLIILVENKERWTNFKYSDKDFKSIKTLIQKQRDKHTAHSFVKEYYDRALAELIK